MAFKKTVKKNRGIPAPDDQSYTPPIAFLPATPVEGEIVGKVGGLPAIYKAVPVFNPNQPVRGMRSGTAPSALPTGILQQLTNVRFNTNVLTVRNGISKLTTVVPIANASYRGSWCGYVNGTFTILAAYRVSSQTLIYSLDPTAYTWTELTSNSGGSRNGVTRLTTDGTVVFEAIRNQGSVDLVIIQNGTDNPRVYNPLASPTVSIHAAITPTAVATYSAQLQLTQMRNIFGQTQPGGAGTNYYPGNSSKMEGTPLTSSYPCTLVTTATPWILSFTTNDPPSGQVVITAQNTGGSVWPQIIGVYQYVRTGSKTGTLTGTTTFAATGAYTGTTSVAVQWGFSCAPVIGGGTGTGKNADPKNCFTFSIDPSAASGDYCYIDCPSVNLTTYTQLDIVFSTTLFGWWNYFKIEAVDTGKANPVTIWDPSAPTVNPIYITGVDSQDTNAVLVAFSLGGISTSAVAGATACCSLKFTYVNTFAQSQAYTCRVEMIALGGNVPGQPQYGISWQNSASYAESYGQILTNVTTNQDVHVTPWPQGVLSFSVPNSPLLNYTAKLYVTDVSSAMISAGTDTLRVYRQDYGEVQFALATSSIPNAWTGSAWPTANAGTVINITDNVNTAGKDFSQIMPDGNHLPIPVGNCMTVNGTRLYVGGVGTNKNEVWISDSTSMVKFRNIVRFLAVNVIDQTSPARDVFPGQIITSLKQSPGQYIGVAPVYVFTNKSVWRLDGVDAVSLNRPSRVNQHGCPFAGSIAEYYGNLYWVDPERQVRTIQSSELQPLSKYKVDDKLFIANLTNCSAAFMLDRYYLAYQPSGQSSNTNILFMELLSNEWGEDVLAAGDAAGLLTIDDNSLRKVYIFANAGLVYRMETPSQTTDAGSGIVATIKTAEYHGDMWQKIARRRLGIASDTGSAAIMVTSTWQPATSGQDGTITLSNAPSGTRAWLWESAALSGNWVSPGGLGVSVYLTVSATLPGGFNFYSMQLELQEQTSDGASAG